MSDDARKLIADGRKHVAAILEVAPQCTCNPDGPPPSGCDAADHKHRYQAAIAWSYAGGFGALLDGYTAALDSIENLEGMARATSAVARLDASGALKEEQERDDIAARLEVATAANIADRQEIRRLEEQVAGLSAEMARRAGDRMSTSNAQQARIVLLEDALRECDEMLAPFTNDGASPGTVERVLAVIAKALS